MSPGAPVVIYRFDSPCGKYCYVGRTENIDARISNHRIGRSPIYDHCRACDKCNGERRNETRWKNLFIKVGGATSDNQADILEQQQIDTACEDYIRNFRKPFPLNLRTEAGSGSLQRAASRIYDVRKDLKRAEQERDRLRVERDALSGEQDQLQSSLESAEQERDSLKRKSIEVEKERDALKGERDKFHEERNTARKQRTSAVREQQRLRKKNDALTSQLSEAQQSVRPLQKRLVNLEQEQVRLRNRNDVLTHKHNQAQEQYHASVDRLASVERELKHHKRLGKRLERKEYGDARNHERLERKFVIAAEIHKRELRRRTRFFSILVLGVMAAAAVVFFALLDPDEMEQGRALLSSLSQDDSASATAPFSSRIITATPRPSLTARPTRTPRPAVTPRPGAKPPDTRYVIVAGEINARACPRRNCTVLRTLEPGSGVTVVEEVRGERVNAASERWALVVLPDLSRRAYVYSAFLGPEPAVPPEASATPPPTTTPRPTTTPTFTWTPGPSPTPRPGAKPPDTRYVIVAGEINARACPRRNCTVLRTLEPGSGVTVVEEVRGERVNAASERWALMVLPDLSRRAYVYSAFLGPEPAVPPEASATPPPTATPRPTTTPTFTWTPGLTYTSRPAATPSRTPNPSSPRTRLLQRPIRWCQGAHLPAQGRKGLRHFGKVDHREPSNRPG